MSEPNYRRTRLACYTSYYTMASVYSLPPLLFVAFRELYGISYTLLGTLVLTNFCTQILVDLIFTFFSKRLNIQKIAREIPLITSLGLALYALSPFIFPRHVYAGLLIGTFIFSVSAGLCEVLLSPVIAALPSDNPQKDMSLLHSLYAFGVFTVVLVSTLFLRIFGNASWTYLTLILALLPIVAACLFAGAPMPDMNAPAPEGSFEARGRRRIGLMLCVGCIFLGSAAENTMSNWISSFMENSLHIDKTLGDLLGMAMFAILLGMVRITYAKYGKHIIPVLMLGMIGAAVCYVIVALSSSVAASFIACILIGMFTSMLWPGTLIMMEEKIPSPGVAAYALMAASGDLGAAAAPQLMGVVVDQVSVSDLAARLAPALSLTVEQVGMKAGMLVTAIFPVLGALLLWYIIRFFRRTGA